MFKTLISTMLVVINIMTMPSVKASLMSDYSNRNQPNIVVNNYSEAKLSDSFKNNKNTINLLIGENAFESTFKLKPDASMDEDFRITTHLKYVENYLRHKEVSSLNPQLVSKRVAMLNLLKQYIANRNKIY